MVIYIAILVSTGTYRMNAAADEEWPKQPHESKYNIPNLTLSMPPYFAGRNFVTPNKTLFFRKRIYLDEYMKNPDHLDKLLSSGDVVRFGPGRILTAREKIVSYEGKVADKEFGNGYVVMASPF